MGEILYTGDLFDDLVYKFDVLDKLSSVGELSFKSRGYNFKNMEF